jgi:carbon-monoxide dehydrogenase large subunit
MGPDLRVFPPEKRMGRNMQYGIGQPVRRREDVRLVTGKGRYTDDLNVEKQVYAAFVRSPHAHAKIGDIDAGEALALPGVLAVLTHKDIVGAPTMPIMARNKNRDGSDMIATPKELLPSDKARFCGEAIAMVIATSPAVARDAAELVAIDYDPLPGVANSDEAKTGAQIWDLYENNLALDWADGDEEGTSEAFSKAAKIVTLDLVQNRVVPAPMEPRVAIGEYDSATERFTLRSGTQGVAGYRDRLARAFKVPTDKLHVITGDVGGGFGQKTAVMVEQMMVLIAAKKIGSPVKWTADRSENFLADTHGRNLKSHCELALDENAQILGIRVTTDADIGAYMSMIGPNVVTTGGMRILGGVNRVPKAFVNVKGYITNSSCISAYRGAGRPEANYIIDRLLDLAATEFGIDRIEIRRRNLIRVEDLPYKNWKGLTIDSGDFIGNLEQAAAQSDWNGFESRRAEAKARGKLRGQGVSYYVEVSSGPPGPEPSKIRFTDNGGVKVYLGTQSNGQGHETTFAQLVCDKLGVAYDQVEILEGDTDYGVEGKGSVGSRSLQTAGNAILEASDEIIRKGKAASAQILQAGSGTVEFINEGDGSFFRVAGTDRSIGLAELAVTLRREKIPGFEDGLDSDGVFDGKPTFPNGCHICELEVDPDTGKVEIDRYIVVDDMGRVVNPLIVEGQVHGGILQGLGQALMENVVYEPGTAQLLTASFLDYAMPRAEDAPPIELSYNEILCTTNALGSKGAGEAGTVGALPAIIGALCDALGVAHIDMPATPEKLWRLARERVS